MSADHIVSIDLAPALKAEILADIETLKQKTSFLIGLTADDRSGMLHMGTKTIGWDEKVASYMASRPDLVPGYVDTATLVKDRKARVDVGDIMRSLGELYQRADDTDMQLAHQIFLPDLTIYHNIDLAAQRHVPGAQAIYDDLRERFPGRPPKSAAAAKKPANP